MSASTSLNTGQSARDLGYGVVQAISKTVAYNTLGIGTADTVKLGTLPASYFGEKFGADVLAEFAPAWRKLEGEGMLRIEEDRIALTRAGLLQVDRLLPSFYDDQYRNARYT